MDSKSRTSWRRALCCVLVPLAGAALADEKPRSLEGAEKVAVSFNLLYTPRGGATSRVVSWGPFSLGAGESMGSIGLPPFAFGAAGDPSGCRTEVGTLTPETILSRQLYAWTADAKVLEASTDHLVLSASWRRFARGQDGEPVESAGESISKLSLREGERVLLDYVVPAAAAQPPCARNYALELTVEVNEDPALAQRQIAYDLWFVHETRDGKKTSARTLLTAGQGERLPFAFPMQKLPALASGGSSDEKLQVTVKGHVRGRIRRDGALELSLGTERMLSYVAPDGSNDGGIGESGEKLVRVQPGEAVRVEMPDPAQGVSKGDPRAPRMAHDLAGHTLSLIVTARPL